VPAESPCAYPLEHSAFAQDRPRSDLRDLRAIHLHGQHAVEQQVELVTRLVLLDEGLTGLERPPSPW
jgi:hypothetical protein